MALADILDLLVCPRCRQPFQLTAAGRVVRCRQGHSFDVARQGYLNLLGSRPPRNADSADMVAARDRFLAAGHYRPVADRLADLVTRSSVAAPRLLEVGAGTGHYLARSLAGSDDARGVALDVSVPAARRAAGAAARLGSVVADVWRSLPLADGSIDVLLDVFAPRNPAEFRRVLAPAGILVTVTPAPAHLHEVRGPLGLLDIQPDKHEQLARTLEPSFSPASSELLHSEVTLDRAGLRDLVAMGPNAFHLSAPELDALVLRVASPLTVTVAVDLGVWRPGEPAAR
jgi:23S rRNA (guanine745-N1)-methyltransferase